MKILPMLNIENTTQLLDKTIFSSLDMTAIEKLLPLLERKSIPRGEVLREMGEEKGDLYIIESGQFRETDADHAVLATYGAGECIGLLAVLFDGPQILSTAATEDSVVLQLDAGSLRMLEFSEPRLSLQILRCIRTALSPSMSAGLRLMYQLYQS